MAQATPAITITNTIADTPAAAYTDAMTGGAENINKVHRLLKWCFLKKI